MVKVLGISASLRNARFGVGSEELCSEIAKLSSEKDVERFLQEQTRIRLDDFITAGRDENLPFDEIYESLQGLKGDRGLSNSEAALTAGLWGAIQEGAEIDHLPLSTHFPPSGKVRRPDELKARVLDADALLLSGPVYFGDRGSLAQAFIEFLTADAEIREHIRGKVYGGIAVGAKRNGGQETTLIYQLVDMVNLNMLGVGNNSETTSQYGGTAVAGDVGSLWEDGYGIRTSIGTGARVARIARILELAEGHDLVEPLKLDVWLLQDTPEHRGLTLLSDWRDRVTAHRDDVSIRIRDFTETEIQRCIACDICPTRLGPTDEYRCIISAKRDLFAQRHAELIDVDAVLLAAYSPKDRQNINSVYQSFIERTRYLRRDNYILGDCLWAPLVLSEISANQNLHIRMLTSAVRQHTVLHHPLIGFEFEGSILNFDELVNQGQSFVDNAKRITIGRYIEGGRTDIVYNPLGYTVSMEKMQRELATGELRDTVERNLTRYRNSKRASVS